MYKFSLRVAKEFKRLLINEEYAKKHWSKDIATSTFIIYGKDKATIYIPAKTYDVSKFFKEGVVVYNGKGSYASDNDIGRGGLIPFRKDGKFKIDGIKVKVSHNHNDFVRRNMKKAINSSLPRNCKIEGKINRS